MKKTKKKKSPLKTNVTCKTKEKSSYDSTLLILTLAAILTFTALMLSKS